ncbi:MAG: PEP-CTERM sorting domain-containing protein [Betaproteobacteria bacterium]|nr:PEP-CTERM sorting domain-containing protein [Betaproteobacteria bacterium]
MRAIHKSVLAVSVAMLFGGAAQAGSVLNIDPDGTGGVGPIYDMASLEWSAGNMLRTPSSVASGTVNNLAAGDVVQNYVQASLGNFRSSSGTLTSTTGYEWTFVGAYQERVEAVLPGFGSSSTFTSTILSGNPSNNYFEIWYDATPDANDRLGKGFQNDTSDAVMVMSGNILPWSGVVGDPGVTSFNTNTGTLVTLDQFGVSNDYGSQQTRSGFGASDNLVVQATYFNSAFFPGLSAASNLSLHMQTQLSLPFNHVDPASCFWNGTAYIGGAGGSFAGACPNTIGSQNGVLAVGVSNEIIQTYTRTGFHIIPEPSSVALMGFGLLGLGLSLRRRKS